MNRNRRLAIGWLALGIAAFALLPWYALPDGVLRIGWVARYLDKENASGLVQALRHGRAWLLPLALLLVVGTYFTAMLKSRATRSNVLIVAGALGFLYLLAQGFAIGARGLSYPWLTATFGPLANGQYGMGLGAALTAAAFAMTFAIGIAERGAFRGDAFVACSVVAVSALVAAFIFYPVATILIQAAQDADGAWSPTAFTGRLFTEKIWGLGCIAGGTRCGVAWNTLVLAILCATIATGLGLAFALIVTRTGFRFKRSLRVLSVLPIITPPFVIGLGLTLIHLIGIPVTTELFFQLRSIGSRTYKVFEVLVAACLWYLVVTSVLMVGQYYLERYFGRGFGATPKATKEKLTQVGADH